MKAEFLTGPPVTIDVPGFVTFANSLIQMETGRVVVHIVQSSRPYLNRYAAAATFAVGVMFAETCARRLSELRIFSHQDFVMRQ